MTSMPTPKTLFGNNSSPNQTNQPISNSPVSRRDAVAVTQSQDSSPMGHLISTFFQIAILPMVIVQRPWMHRMIKRARIV